MTEDEWRTSRHGQQMLAFVQTAKTPFRTRWLSWTAARRFAISERKVRLVEAACCDRIAKLVPVIQVRRLIGLARQQAEGKRDTGHHLPALEQALVRLAGCFISNEGANSAQAIIDALEFDSNGGTASLFDIIDGRPAPLLAIAAVGRLFCRRSDPGDDVLTLAGRARAEEVAFGLFSGAYERQLLLALLTENAHQADLVRDAIGNPFRRESIDPVWLSANDRAATRIAEGIAEGDTFGDLPILADALEDAGCTEEAILAHCRGPGPHVAGCWVVDLVRGLA